MKTLFLSGVVALSCLVMLAGCRCNPAVVGLTPAQLVATPTHLVLTPTYLGQSTHGVVSVLNNGAATGVADVAISAPFTVDVGHLQLLGGESVELTVSFSPQAVGHASATLHLGPLEVQVDADGLELPVCLPQSVCFDAHFDTTTAQCLDAPKPDGTSCETSCVSGACTAGTCLGALKGCDDHNACTLDACDETAGCSHSLRTCPEPTAPCQVARCDSATGCGSEVAPDGTLCGPDDCLATQVQVCIVGQCVTRTRPDTGRCANRWVATTVPARFKHAMAYDEARRRVVLFGGAGAGSFGELSDTWEWDGAR
jgi:hypothetical protein